MQPPHSTADPAKLQEERKRKAANLDEILQANLAKTPRVIRTVEFKTQFQNLREIRRQWLITQRRGSLLVQPHRIDTDEHPMKIFGLFFRQVSCAPTYPDDHEEQMKLIKEVVQESIVIEWPKAVKGLFGDDELFDDIDQAPVIHRARNVVKCRTSHPTMRVKVFAIEDTTGTRAGEPRLMEAFFRATLVKVSRESNNEAQTPVAGRLILTQREGTPATKQSDQLGATVSKDGKLIASQALEGQPRLFPDQYREHVRTTPLKFENGTLCATFPEMGVTLNSMVDRRQLSTRYAIHLEVALNIDNKLLVQHTILSHPFLIAITNDQTECLMQTIFWDRLEEETDKYASVPSPPPTTSQNVTTVQKRGVKWGILKEAIKNFMKAQNPLARALTDDEILHVQCMTFLKFVSSHPSVKLDDLELEIYGNILPTDEGKTRAEAFRDRLLTEHIREEREITKDEFMKDRCHSIVSLKNDLNHSVWLWLYRAAEMVVDVGHKLCPAPVIADKKGVKGAKKQVGNAADYETMLTLFNKRYLTLLNPLEIHRIMTSPLITERSLMVRFCDENAGYISFVFNLQDGTDQLHMGSISADQVKDFKQGLPEVIIDENFPSTFQYMVKVEGKENTPQLRHIRRQIFKAYQTLRLQNHSIYIGDDERFHRVNPLTGENSIKNPEAQPPQEQQPLSPTDSYSSVFSTGTIKTEAGEEATAPVLTREQLAMLPSLLMPPQQIAMNIPAGLMSLFGPNGTMKIDASLLAGLSEGLSLNAVVEEPEEQHVEGVPSALASVLKATAVSTSTVGISNGHS